MKVNTTNYFDGAKIDSFKGTNFYLSNFFEADVEYEGIKYKSNEAAFQAAKSTDKKVRLVFATLNSSEAKRMGRSLNLRKDWEQVKFEVMYQIVKAKFTQNPELGKKLLSTEGYHLEEGNDWGDRIWGTVNGHGKNALGRTLMRVREELRGHKWEE